VLFYNDVHAVMIVCVCVCVKVNWPLRSCTSLCIVSTRRLTTAHRRLPSVTLPSCHQRSHNSSTSQCVSLHSLTVVLSLANCRHQNYLELISSNTTMSRGTLCSNLLTCGLVFS